MATGMGPIFSMILAYYPGQELRANDLLTYPTLFMGLGNLMTMPLALTIGRRPIFLGSMVVMMAGGVWCACSRSLGSHIAGRAIMSLAAGQSEALSPMIVQGKRVVDPTAIARTLMTPQRSSSSTNAAECSPGSSSFRMSAPECFSSPPPT